MSKKTFALPEIIAMLQAEGFPSQYIAAVEKRAEFVAEKRQTHGEIGDWQVGSGYNSMKDRGHVRLQIEGLEHQLEPKKAVQIGLWLIEAAEAAIADATVMTWIKQKIGITDHGQLGELLLQLREIRQGSREVVYHP